MTAAVSYEQMAGKGLSLINWSSPFHLSACNGYCAFQTAQFEAVRNHGTIPFFSWNPGPGGGPFTDAEIAAGAQDAYITEWAEAARKWGHPFFLRFAWEMNGAWFPWGVGNEGTTAAEYVAMWRHVHAIFDSADADNVSWVWCPNIDPYGKRTPLASVYPGDAYVDWTCLDGYNGANPWASFSDLFKSSYETIISTIAPTKPMVVGETASTEAGGSKPQWIEALLKALPADFPKIHGLLWFDKTESGPGGHSDWPLASSPASAGAFAAGIQGDAYAPNDFAQIATSPIPPP
jgi:Glycosyl hydrolase family 26